MPQLGICGVNPTGNHSDVATSEKQELQAIIRRSLKQPNSLSKIPKRFRSRPHCESGGWNWAVTCCSSAKKALPPPPPPSPPTSTKPRRWSFFLTPWQKLIAFLWRRGWHSGLEQQAEMWLWLWLWLCTSTGHYAYSRSLHLQLIVPSLLLPAAGLATSS